MYYFVHMVYFRYNKFQTDPYAESDPWGAIAARGDLAEDPYGGGGYDTKITNYAMFFAGQSSVVNGPTSQDQVRCAFLVLSFFNAILVLYFLFYIIFVCCILN